LPINTNKENLALVRSTTINLPDDITTKYASDLKQLVTAWSHARNSKTVKDINDFKILLSNVAQNYEVYALHSLQQMFHTIEASCLKGINKKTTVAKTISDIDWLMNQLIRSNKLIPDPFLLQSSNSKTFLSKQIKSAVMPAHQPMKIAIVDDERSVGMALSAILKQFALEVQYFNSINEFEVSLKEDVPDLVLLDIVMPNVSNEQVFAYARQLVDHGIKVISCSSLFSFETRLRAVRAGVSDYVVKPVNPYSLVEKITRALKRDVIKSYQIILLDDQESMGEFYKAVFSQVNVDFHFFTSAESLLSAMDCLQPDLFLLDRIMPSVNGLEVAAMIRQESKFDFSPIVFLTADERIDTKLNILDYGADDLIVKTTPAPIVVEQVMARLERAAFIRSFVSKDPLTGVLNHGQIVEVANHQMQLNKRKKSESTLALIDVDLFKSVNDTYGHTAGDMVLNGIGQLLKSAVRETDYVGRYGGEEFMILFVDCNVEQAYLKLDLIREKCQKMHFVHDKPQIKVTFSGGLVALEDYQALPLAISEADRLMYLAKTAGRNTLFYPDNEPS
jgi:diguanylate cyclase (GGDEF)-like protein